MTIKQTIMFAALLLCTSMNVHAQLTNGLVAHWPFNGNANDASGNGYNGTPTNISYTTGSNGTANTAALFNGNSSYIDVAYQSGLNVNNFSICAVVKANGWYTGLCQASVIVWRGSQYASGHYGLQFMDNAYDNGNCTAIDTSKNVFVPTVGNTSSSAGYTELLYTPTMITQKWYCVVLTYSGTQSKIYVDGVLKSTFNISSGGLGSSTQGLAIGANRFNQAAQFPYWLNGAIDDLRIYNRVLPDSEIVQYCGVLLDTTVYISQPLIKNTYCANDTFHLNYGTTFALQSGNTYTAQLSDATGSFASPVSIGNVTATGNGTIICTVPSNITTGSGYRVRVVSSNPARTSVPNTVNLTLTPKPNITAAANGPVCEGQSLQLNATSTSSGVTYSWTGPAGFNSSSQNPVISSTTLANNGDYIATATLNGCSGRDTVFGQVKITPVKPTVGSNSPVCSRTSINFTASSTTGATYSWSGPGGYTSTTQNATRPNALMNMAGYYSVTASINGCTSAADSTQVVIIAAPEIGAIPSPGNVICDGDTITFLAFASNAGQGAIFQWMKNGNAVAGADSLKYKAGGLANGDVVYIAMTPGPGGACSGTINSMSIPIVTLPYLSPTISITVDPTTPVWEGLLVNFTATVANAGIQPKYQWMRNGQPVQGATAATWGTTELKNNDIIHCEIISDYKCPQPKVASSNSITVSVTTSVTDNTVINNTLLYPNPNKGSFTLKGTIPNGNVTIDIVNTMGQIVYKNEVRVTQGILEKDVNLTNIPNGVYLLRMQAGAEQRSIKFNISN